MIRNTIKTSLCALFFCAFFFPSGSLAAPHVPEATNRVKLNFNTDWLYQIGEVSGAQAANFDDNGWEPVSLPHTMRIEPLLCGGGMNYQGVGWYRRHFCVPDDYQGKKIFIEFEGAMKVATVYLNGNKLTTHYGGYLGFLVDITDEVNFGDSENVLAVWVDNGDDYPDVPPGKPQKNLDFNYYGGIYRDVNLIVTDNLHVTDVLRANKVAGGGIYVTYPSVSTSSSTVRVRTHVLNEGSSAMPTSVKSTLVDSAGEVVAEVTSSTQSIGPGGDYTFDDEFVVTNPNLWHYDHPYLYTLQTAVHNGSEFVDHYTTTIGIRSIEVEGYTLILNGEKQDGKMIGSNRHQEYPYVGYALPNSGQIRDVKMIREGGMNCVRTSHYPQDPAFLDACDKYGLMFMNCVAGWQWFRENTTFQDRCYQQLREMLRRDRNHPAFYIAEIALNESNHDYVNPRESPEFREACLKILREEFPGYIGYNIENPYIPREVGYARKQSITGITRDQGEEAEIACALSRAETGVAHGLFSGAWVMFDYNRGSSSVICKGGLVDYARIPKWAYYMYMSQREADVTIPGVELGPMIFIMNNWTSSSPLNPITVYSNCEKVRLYVNGTLQGTETPSTEFKTSKVPQGAFKFAGVSFASGTLRAEGLIGGEVVTSQEIRTPGTASQIGLRIDSRGVDLIADGSDLVMVYAYVQDAKGTTMPDADNLITFSVEGPGEIIGTGDSHVNSNPVSAQAGVITALLRGQAGQVGNITVTASAKGLRSGTATIESKPLLEPTVPVEAGGRL